MGSYPNHPNHFGRQMSDTYYYNNHWKGERTTQNDKRKISGTEPIRETRHGSLKNTHTTYNALNESSSRYFNYQPNNIRPRTNSSDTNNRLSDDAVNQTRANKRSENVVRFHKDVVTDIHDFRDKIHVDEVGSNYSGQSLEYIANDVDSIELQNPTKDYKIHNQSLNRTRQSSERDKDVSQSDKKRKESKTRTKESSFITQNSTSEKLPKSSRQKHDSGIDKTGRHLSDSSNIQMEKPERPVRANPQRPSSKKRHASSKESQKVPSVKSLNGPNQTKAPVRKTRSNTSSGSNQSDRNFNKPRSNGFHNQSKPHLSLTNKNGSARHFSKQYTGPVDLTGTNGDKHSRSRKGRKMCCLFLSLVITMVIVAALVIGVVFFIENKGSTIGVQDKTRVYDMINVHVRLRVLNHNYTVNLQNNSSPQFTRFSVQMCNEVDLIYITSHMSQNYYGCKLVSLRSGSVRVYYVSPFLETLQTTNISLHREILLNNLITLFSPALPVNTTVLGDFLVDVNSIEISIEKFQTTELPQKPMMPNRVTSTFSTSSVIQNTRSDTTTTSSKSSSSSDKQIVPSSTRQLLNSTKFMESTTLETQSYIQKGSTVPSTFNRTSPDTVTYTSLEISTSTHDVTQINNVKDNAGVTDITSPNMGENQHINGNNELKIDKNLLRDKDNKKRKLNEDSYNDLTITARNASVYLQTEPARIEFLVNNTQGIQSLTIGHQDFRGHISTFQTLKKKELNDKKEIVEILSRTKTISFGFGEDSMLIRLDFKTVKCDEVGVYTCNLVTTDGDEVFANGILNGTSAPGVPQLSLPIALIENQEIKKPIMCTADVGFPNGYLQWMIKPKGVDDFLPFQGHFISHSGDCDNYVTNSLIYTPTKDGNGTLLKCEVVNKHVPHPPDLTAVTDLYILPENLCEGIRINKTIRHPFTCTKFIRCYGDRFEVEECKNKMCYDEETMQCGQTKLKMDDVVAYLNEGVTSLQCRLDHLGAWNNMTISKVKENGGKEPIVSVISDGSDVIVYDTDMKDRVFVHKESSQDFEIKLNLWVYILTCADEGEYNCQAYTPDEFKVTTSRIDLRGKPEAPKLSIPNEVIEGLPLRQNVTCEANVGYPQGNLVLKMKFQNETEFRPIIFNVTTEEIVQNCSKTLRKSFTFTPTLNNEKTELLCEVENKFTLPLNRRLVALETLHVVPKNFCLTHGSSTPQVHPYDCHQYVQCTEGYTYVQRCGSDHCFNPDTLHCDLKVKDADGPYDPKRPCFPDKNGVFYHHPILCNKYIWCVQGQEVVHHCPLGTLYIDGGQCTFEPDKSRCYQDPDETSS